jgi:Flp pilus assembly protein TadG
MARLKKPMSRRGTVLLETALILPVLLLLTIGLLEYGWMFLKLEQINSAAREGVRAGVRADGDNTDVTAAVLAAMTRANLESSGYTLSTTPSDVSRSGGTAGGTTVTVRVEVTYNNIKLIGAPMTPLPTTLSGEYNMMKEGL